MPLTDYVIMPGADYQAACDAVRAKTKKTDLIKSGDFANEINSIAINLPLGYELKEILSEPELEFTVKTDGYFPKNPSAIIADDSNLENCEIISDGESGLVVFDNELYPVYASNRTPRITWANGNAATLYADNAIGNLSIPAAWAYESMTVAEGDSKIANSGEPFLIVANSSCGFQVVIPKDSTNLTHTLRIFKFVK